MKELNYSSKKAQSFIEAYDKSRKFDINDAYENPSLRKRIAFYDCRKNMLDEEGVDIRIISKNTFQFTCAWRTKGALRVETRDNSYIIYLPF